MFNRDFKEFVELLNDHKVRYLVVGGFAVAFHGYPRYTKDLDIWIEASSENARALVKALDEFGMGSLGLHAGDFLNEDQIIQLGYPPDRIDILSGITGVKFSSAYPHRVKTTINGIDVDFIDLENLKINKKATGRLQDLADLENLEDKE
ncbi:MAG: DUF6036 family nucleotidyltransferase [Anaerolineaceae bacterium]